MCRIANYTNNNKLNNSLASEPASQPYSQQDLFTLLYFIFAVSYSSVKYFVVTAMRESVEL